MISCGTLSNLIIFSCWLCCPFAARRFASSRLVLPPSLSLPSPPYKQSALSRLSRSRPPPGISRASFPFLVSTPDSSLLASHWPVVISPTHSLLHLLLPMFNATKAGKRPSSFLLNPTPRQLMRDFQPPGLSDAPSRPYMTLQSGVTVA